MTWQTRVAAWVIPLVSGYVIPDDAQVITGVEFGTLEDAEGAVTLNNTRKQASYPGLVPNFSLDPELTPTTSGTQYNLKAKKAVGFYGVECEILSFEPKRLNSWTFPLERRNFGHLALSRGDVVALSDPMHYESQYHFSEAIQALALNYDDDFSTQTLTNSVDKFCLNKVSVFLYPEVVLQVSFLPVWEVWAIRFFKSLNYSCTGSFSGDVPGGYVPGISSPPPYKDGDYVASNDGFTYAVRCSEADGFSLEKLGRWNG